MRRRSQERPGPRSQGGDTGSNPVGTTTQTCWSQAKAGMDPPRTGDSLAADPVMIPREVTTQHRRRRLVMLDRACTSRLISSAAGIRRRGAMSPPAFSRDKPVLDGDVPPRSESADRTEAQPDKTPAAARARARARGGKSGRIRDLPKRPEAVPRDSCHTCCGLTPAASLESTTGWTGSAYPLAVIDATRLAMAATSAEARATQPIRGRRRCCS